MELGRSYIRTKPDDMKSEEYLLGLLGGNLYKMYLSGVDVLKFAVHLLCKYLCNENDLLKSGFNSCDMP